MFLIRTMRGRNVRMFDWSNDLEEKLAELELRVEELEKEKMEFISELYRMENALDSRIDSILNKLI